MSAKKKFLSIAMVFALLLNFAAFGASAAVGDGQALSVDMKLDVGTYVGGVFTPVTLGQTFATGDQIAVRVTSHNDFYTAGSRIVTLFSKEYFTLVGPTGPDAYDTNPANAYINQAVSSFSGTLSVPAGAAGAWNIAYGTTEGPNMAALYQATAISFVAAATSGNGGYPVIMPDTWLFEFKLNVIKDIVPGSNARIFIDPLWLRSPAATTLIFWFSKCASAADASNTGSSTTFNFMVDTSQADVALPLAANSSVTFNSDGGSAVAPLTGTVGSPLTPPANPVKEGYTFDRWDPPLPQTFPEQGMTFTALWNINSYNLQYLVDGSAYSSFQVPYMGQLPGVADPVKAGYTFERWEPTPPAQMPAADVTLNAVFTPIQYTVTFDDNGGIGGTQDNLDYGSPLVPPTVTRDFYTFAGWSPTPPATVPIEGGTYTAQWTINQTTVTFDTDGGSAIAPLTGDIYSPLTPPANPEKAGYTFDRWSSTLPTSFPEQNLTVTAIWTPNVYDAIFMVDGVEYARIPTAYGTAIAPPANPQKDGFIFTGWNPVPGTMGAADETFEAVFANAVTSVMITLNEADIGPSHAVKVPMFTMFRDYPVQLGYVTDADPSFRVEFTSDNDKVTVDSTGLVTNYGNTGREANITVTVYDAEDNPVATDTVKISFYKFKWEMLFNWFMQILALLGLAG